MGKKGVDMEQSLKTGDKGLEAGASGHGPGTVNARARGSRTSLGNGAGAWRQGTGSRPESKGQGTEA